MALFSRKDRNADIEKYITQAVEKAAQSLMGTPMYNQAGKSASWAQPRLFVKEI